MIRFIILASFVILFLILSIPLLIAEWIIGKFNMDLKNRSSLAIVNWAFRGCLWVAGTKVIVRGEENVPKEEPVLYVGNHRSYFDIVITYARCPRPTGYVAKDSMLKIPFLSGWMKRLHCLFLDRKDLKAGMKMILTGIEQIKGGISMCIFPEGTRVQSQTETDMLPFKEGSLKMAEKTGCAIIPMALTHTADIFENHIPFIRRTRVALIYGKPVYPKQLDKEQRRHMGAYTQELIRGMLEEALNRE